MSFIEKQPRKWGDRRDGVWVKDAPGLNVVMASLFPKRADCEVYLRQEIDITELLQYIDRKNTPDAPYKTTLFHCIVTMVARVLNERPFLNRFVQGRRIYQRDEITVSFVAKRKFSDHSEEALMQYTARGEHTLADISRLIVGDVQQMRKESKANDINKIIDAFGRLPRPVLMLIIHWIRVLDFWGKTPKFLQEGDSNCASVLLSNLGSIQCPSVYHHLNNYGTNSVMITIGAIHKVPVVGEDGQVQIRDYVDIGATLDERIADGFYFARSLKLIQHICAHPELLDRPLQEESNYEYA